MNWRVFSKLVASALLFVVAEPIVQACADGDDPYDYYPSFFDNRATAEPAFAPFYYTGYQLFYDGGYWGDEASKNGFIDAVEVPDANLVEWQSYTAANIPLADLDSFIYSCPLVDVTNFYFHLEKARPLSIPAAMEGNGMTRWFQSSKDLEALGYLMHAKKCEPMAMPEWTDWEPVKRDTSQAGKLIKAGLQLHAAAQKDFFKKRYAYQVLRTAFYSGRYKQTLQLYNTLYPTTEPEGEIGQRIVGLRAGALNRLGQKAEAAYLYSKLFAANDARKKSDYLSYKFSGGFENKAAVLKLCKTGSEQAAVHILHGLYEYDKALPHMQAAYAADPAARGLEVLMAREIAKIEERYYRSKIIAERNIESSQHYWDRYADYYGDDPEMRARRARFAGYPEQLSSFAQTMAQASPRRGFWTISLAYLAFLQDDMVRTKSYLGAARTQTLSPRETELARVISALAVIRSTTPLTAVAEAELLPNLRWLEERAGKDLRLAKSYRDLMSTQLATAYLKSRDTVKAVYALARGNYAYVNDTSSTLTYGPDEDFQDLSGTLLEAMSEERLQDMKAFTASAGKTAYDRWLTSGVRTYSPEVLDELEGTKLIRQHRFAEAVSVLEKCSDAFLNKRILPNPFHAEIKDWMEPTEGDKPTYNKLGFARRMAELQKRDDAESRFRYGTGLYSMTYYGKAHSAHDYFRSAVDGNGYYEDAGRKKMPRHLQEYYGVYAAEAAFKEAIAKATDPELKARAIWMAAKCWQKRCPAPPTDADYKRAEKDYYGYSLRNPYFAELMGTSARTAFYSEAGESCAWLRDFAKKK